MHIYGVLKPYYLYPTKLLLLRSSPKRRRLLTRVYSGESCCRKPSLPAHNPTAHLPVGGIGLLPVEILIRRTRLPPFYRATILFPYVISASGAWQSPASRAALYSEDCHVPLAMTRLINTSPQKSPGLHSKPGPSILNHLHICIFTHRHI